MLTSIRNSPRRRANTRAKMRSPEVKERRKGTTNRNRANLHYPSVGLKNETVRVITRELTGYVEK
jgi:hypothetical protein